MVPPAAPSGTCRSSPSVTALIFTAEMVASNGAHRVIIPGHRLLQPASVHADRQFSRILAVASLSVLVACSPASSTGAPTTGNRIVTPVPAGAAATRPQATPRAADAPAAI